MVPKAEEEMEMEKTIRVTGRGQVAAPSDRIRTQSRREAAANQPAKGFR